MSKPRHLDLALPRIALEERRRALDRLRIIEVVR